MELDVWEVRFIETLTESETFQVSSDRQIQVVMMSNEEELGCVDFKLEVLKMMGKFLMFSEVVWTS